MYGYVIDGVCVFNHSVASDSATPWTVACQALLSMGIFQARILKWVTMLSSRGSSQPKDQTRSPALQVDSLPSEPLGKPKNIGVGSLSLLQGIFLTQESNWGLPPQQADSLPAELPGKSDLTIPLTPDVQGQHFVKHSSFCTILVSKPVFNLGHLSLHLHCDFKTDQDSTQLELPHHQRIRTSHCWPENEMCSLTKKIGNQAPLFHQSFAF